jgi:DNA-binding IclR family transcriptional regulator
MDDWWSAIDGEILATLAEGRPMEPAEIARRLGLPEASATSLICGLVSAGKVRVCLVEANH